MNSDYFKNLFGSDIEPNLNISKEFLYSSLLTTMILETDESKKATKNQINKKIDMMFDFDDFGSGIEKPPIHFSDIRNIISDDVEILNNMKREEIQKWLDENSDNT